MALTDSDRLHATTIALMRHNVISHKIDAILQQPTGRQGFNAEDYLTVNKTVTPNDYVALSYSYTIT